VEETEETEAKRKAIKVGVSRRPDILSVHWKKKDCMVKNKFLFDPNILFI
jgi:hypothetical protein